MIANTAGRDFEVIEITNEMPHNRMGGVGSVIESLMSGFESLGVRALWFVTDHEYQTQEIEAMLAGPRAIAFGRPEELAAFRAPVAHVHSYRHAPDLLAALGDARSLFTVHSLLVEEERSNDIDLGDAVAAQERLIGQCDEVALVSAAERVRYERLGYLRLNPRVSVVHNGVAAQPRRRVRRRRDVIGYCGRLVPRKHPEYAALVLQEPGFEACRALVAGKAFARYTRDLVRERGLEERCRYLGWCAGPRLATFHEAIDVLVQPSTYEPFGLAALEAAARGTPIVCSAVDGLVEVLGDGAFYSDDTSFAAFCEAMRRWRTASPDELEERTATAHRRARAAFTDVAMAERYRDRFAALAT